MKRGALALRGVVLDLPPSSSSTRFHAMRPTLFDFLAGVHPRDVTARARSQIGALGPPSPRWAADRFTRDFGYDPISVVNDAPTNVWSAATFGTIRARLSTGAAFRATRPIDGGHRFLRWRGLGLHG